MEINRFTADEAREASGSMKKQVAELEAEVKRLAAERDVHIQDSDEQWREVQGLKQELDRLIGTVKIVLDNYTYNTEHGGKVDDACISALSSATAALLKRLEQGDGN